VRGMYVGGRGGSRYGKEGNGPPRLKPYPPTKKKKERNRSSFEVIRDAKRSMKKIVDYLDSKVKSRANSPRYPSR